MQANKTADNQYLIPLMDGIIENIDIADGILLTTSEFVSQEDIEMTTTHDDLSLFQISFCIDGNMEWSYINNEVVHQFQIAAQQSQVRYGTFKECRSRISGNRKFKGISITIGGKDVREFTSDSLLKNMSMVFQNVYLFKDTIENNIKFGCPEASHEQVVEAAKKARCHDFISLLPEGYNTMIGEGGSTLSGGEKQRISIARAMLKNAPVVLLDEATASVDPENEVYLQQAISTLVKDKTLIVIAHRLSTIRDAEQILVIDNGKLVQHGKHDELVLQEGIYQKYWNIRQNAKAWKVAQ